MKRILVALVVVVLGALFVGTLWYLWRKAQKPPVVYETETPIRADIVKKAVATGSVIPRKEVAVKPQVSGIIESVKVEAGQTVRRGELLAEIRVIPETAALAAAESRVNLAKIRSEDAERELERNRKLYDNGIIPETDFRRVLLARDNVREELAAARDHLEVVRRGATSRSADTGNTLVRATIGGAVLDVPVREGSSVIEANTFNEGTTIATLADMGSLIFEGKVDESEVGKLRPGMDMVLTIGALEPARFEGILEHIAPKGVEENGAIQFKIRAALKGIETAVIRANYSANADIVLDRREGVLALNESLIQFEGDRAFVEIETAPQQFERREIKTGLSDGITVEILEGLAETDRVKAAVAAQTGK